MGDSYPTTITFNASDPQYPPPSRYDLELHALCCEVTMLAGAGEYVDWVQDKIEETRVLARDRSSAQLFFMALSAISVHENWTINKEIVLCQTQGNKSQHKAR